MRTSSPHQHPWVKILLVSGEPRAISSAHRACHRWYTSLLRKQQHYESTEWVVQASGHCDGNGVFSSTHHQYGIHKVFFFQYLWVNTSQHFGFVTKPSSKLNGSANTLVFFLSLIHCYFYNVGCGSDSPVYCAKYLFLFSWRSWLTQKEAVLALTIKFLQFNP